MGDYGHLAQYRRVLDVRSKHDPSRDLLVQEVQSNERQNIPRFVLILFYYQKVNCI